VRWFVCLEWKKGAGEDCLMTKRGLFVVFEGIDGSGKSTQIEMLAHHIRKLDKYNEYLLAREPTFGAEELRRKLAQDKNAFSDGDEMALLYVNDGARHLGELIEPVLKAGRIVLCDRYKLSTYAYQETQGVSRARLEDMHHLVGIYNPDLTFLIDVDAEVAHKRRIFRGEKLDKFEQGDFQGKLIEKYRELVDYSRENPNFVGCVKVINGHKSKEDVFELIRTVFDSVYHAWKSIA